VNCSILRQPISLPCGFSLHIDRENEAREQDSAWQVVILRG
jgi:hypothetical protein